MRPVAKRSIGKMSSGGAKDAHRLLVDGVAVKELVVSRERGVADVPGEHRTLSHLLVERGVVITEPSLQRARDTASAATSELPRSAFTLSPGDPVLVTEVVVPPTTRRSNL
jgi:hypothetical protein